VYFCHSGRAWSYAVQVNTISGEGIWPSLPSIKEYKIHQHTHRSYSPNNDIWSRWAPGLFPAGSTVDSGHSSAALVALCDRFGPHTPPSTGSAMGKRYVWSGRRELMNPKRSASDTKQWRLYSSDMLSLADWIEWDLTLSNCARTWYPFVCVIPNVGHCFSIHLSRSP